MEDDADLYFYIIQPDVSDGGWVPVKDYALLCGISPSYARQLARREVVCAKKLGGRWFFRITGFGRTCLEALKESEGE